MIDSKIINRCGIWAYLGIIYLAYTLLLIYSDDLVNDKNQTKKYIFYLMWAVILTLYTLGIHLTIDDLYKHEDEKEISIILVCYYITLVLILVWGIIFHVGAKYRDKYRLWRFLLEMSIVALLCLTIWRSNKWFGLMIPITTVIGIASVSSY